MRTPMTPDALERLARQRAGRKLGWYLHAFVFLRVNTVLAPGSRWRARLVPQERERLQAQPDPR